MISNYEEAGDFLNPTVYFTSTHLDALIIRYQMLQQLTDKPPPACVFAVFACLPEKSFLNYAHHHRFQ